MIESATVKGASIVSRGFLVPDEAKLLSVVTMLFGEDAKVKATEINPDDEALCAVYVSDDESPVAAVLCDPAFGAFAGSALSMIPAGGAADAAARGELSDAMVDNLYEVMNICSNLFMDDSTPHLRLGLLHKKAGERSDDVCALLGQAEGPSFEVQIPRYGSGLLRLMR